MADLPPTEWQCSCGKWVPIGFGRHTHVELLPLPTADMIAARAEGHSFDTMEAAKMTWVYRNKGHETR